MTYATLFLLVCALVCGLIYVALRIKGDVKAMLKLKSLEFSLEAKESRRTVPRSPDSK